MTTEHIHLVTGRLAEHALRETMHRVAKASGMEYSIGVLPISVAALMTPAWIASRVAPPEDATQILIPGYCDGDLQPIQAKTGLPTAVGPKDLRQLPEYFGQPKQPHDLESYDIEILAEINHAPRLDLATIRQTARRLEEDGADLIDVGCEPGEAWDGVADCVRALCDDGHRVSIDSWNPAEVEAAISAGAELILSVNSSNAQVACDWERPVVVVPDDFATLGGLDQTIERLTAAGIPFRIDPILEPIGCGLADSLHRYVEVRRRYPTAEIMMGIGNLTELTDTDSAGINMLLLGVCQELGVRSVLTTQVINWARSSVRECDLARRLVRFAVTNRVPPKRIDSRLIMLRDDQTHAFGSEELDRLAETIKDNNYRIFAEDENLHLLSAGMHLQDADPFRLFASLMETEPRNVDPSHAFYLGFELAKAMTALTLGKQYRQDEALDWGFLTRPEQHHRLPRGRNSS